MSEPTPSAPLRLFLALWPGTALRRELARGRDALPWREPGRPVPDAQLHLTLHFIGAVPADRLDAVAAGLQVEAPVVELVLDRVEVWPRGLVVWCAGSVPPALQQLQVDLAQRLRRLALPVDERPFRPHVTLARSAALQQPAQLPPLAWTAQGYALVRSRPDRRYEVLQQYG